MMAALDPTAEYQCPFCSKWRPAAAFISERGRRVVTCNVCREYHRTRRARSKEGDS